MSADSKDTRIAELDVLRGVAAVWVMVFHYMVRWFEQPGPPVSRFGEMAVHLFFMISGFVIFMTLQRTETARDFVVSRFSRLYPVYWAAVLVTAAVMWVAPPFEKSAVTLPQVAANLTMLQQWLRVPGVDGVYWTLAVELAFYGWMFVIFKLRALPRIGRIAAAWMLIAIVARIAERVIYQERMTASGVKETLFITNPEIIPAVISRTFLLEYAHLFFAGIVFYQIRQHGAKGRHALLLGLCLFTQYFLHGPLATPFLAMFCSIFFFLARRKLAWLAVRPLVFLGTISYSLYLVHQNIGYTVMRQLDGHIQGVQVAAACAVSIALASILTFCLEKPALRALRMHYAKKRAARGMAAVLDETNPAKKQE